MRKSNYYTHTVLKFMLTLSKTWMLFDVLHILLKILVHILLLRHIIHIMLQINIKYDHVQIT